MRSLLILSHTKNELVLLKIIPSLLTGLEILKIGNTKVKMKTIRFLYSHLGQSMTTIVVVV